MVHAPASCGRGLEGDGRTIDPRSDAPSSKKTRKVVGESFKRFFMEYIHGKMSLNYASLLHVLSQPISLFNSSRLDKRLDDDLITSARRADVSLPARPSHACTCYCKFPGNQGRGQPVWNRAAATGPPIGNGPLGFEWSRDRRRHVTQKGQGPDPNMLNAQYLENGWRWRLGSNGPPIGNDPLGFKWSRD